MNEIALHNPTKVDVVDYPISEAVLDKEFNPKIDRDTQQIITTGETNVWTIMSGETVIFPKYVAKYLMGIYDFLETRNVEDVVVEKEDVKTEENEEGETVVAKYNEDGKPVCKYCGQVAGNMRGLGMHIASKHPDKLF